ncbi:MAG: hypothetical protein DRP09_21330 [Candidatus Thorarchaeota archaeon]|nr:MAG: hypothetical protein DRP09_21330 [Candidatus Thorarchaeota archaeon]
MKRTESFDDSFGDGDDYFENHLSGKGWITLWRPAPYHWVAMNIEQRKTFEYVEGDLYETTYDSEEEFIAGLKKIKEWWVEHEGKNANAVLMALAEPFGFLTGNTITLNPPRCKNCGRYLYPKVGENEDRSCLLCGDLPSQMELLSERLRAEGVSEEEYNSKMGL